MATTRRGAKQAARTPAKKAVRTPAKQAARTPAKKAAPSARARGVTVDVYAAKLAPAQRAAFELLRRIVAAAAPGVTASIKWGQPVFEAGGPLCYARGSRAHLTFGFWRGAELAAQGFAGLEGTGSRMRHLRVTGPADVDRARIGRMVRAAARLNAERGDPTRG